MSSSSGKYTKISAAVLKFEENLCAILCVFYNMDAWHEAVKIFLMFYDVTLI